jgi:hypothetical protein
MVGNKGCISIYGGNGIFVKEYDFANEYVQYLTQGAYLNYNDCIYYVKSNGLIRQIACMRSNYTDNHYDVGDSLVVSDIVSMGFGVKYVQGNPYLIFYVKETGTQGLSTYGIKESDGTITKFDFPSFERGNFIAAALRVFRYSPTLDVYPQWNDNYHYTLANEPFVKILTLSKYFGLSGSNELYEINTLLSTMTITKIQSYPGEHGSGFGLDLMSFYFYYNDILYDFIIIVSKSNTSDFYENLGMYAYINLTEFVKFPLINCYCTVTACYCDPNEVKDGFCSIYATGIYKENYNSNSVYSL